MAGRVTGFRSRISTGFGRMILCEQIGERAVVQFRRELREERLLVVYPSPIGTQPGIRDSGSLMPSWYAAHGQARTPLAETVQPPQFACHCTPRIIAEAAFTENIPRVRDFSARPLLRV